MEFSSSELGELSINKFHTGASPFLDLHTSICDLCSSFQYFFCVKSLAVTQCFGNVIRYENTSERTQKTQACSSVYQMQRAS